SLLPGVTRWPGLVELPAGAGATPIRLIVETRAGELPSAPCGVRVGEPPSDADALRVWTHGDPPSLAFLRRRGWEATTLAEGPEVALVTEFEPLRESLPLDD